MDFEMLEEIKDALMEWCQDDEQTVSVYLDTIIEWRNESQKYEQQKRRGDEAERQIEILKSDKETLLETQRFYFDLNIKKSNTIEELKQRADELEERWERLRSLLKKSRASIAVDMFRNAQSENKIYFECLSDVLGKMKKLELQDK